MFRSKIPRMFNCKKRFLKKVCVSNFLYCFFFSVLFFFCSTKQIKNNPRVMEVSQFVKGAERDSLKKWIPIMEMQYRGAVYRDWCQGGLPEEPCYSQPRYLVVFFYLSPGSVFT
ncbi:uncharacterized protein LOC133706026 isoform X2 [Populus nigra]|uniref:uncharacterized protein LOC133706026 isoform X2 n=1 Tax=Populus nigra TaxID=3691 RepID=UPI002B266A75|nr:uncharacterized protein LOC133706026 isoform X2 [Populus nigra]